jgi:hypothetical protein
MGAAEDLRGVIESNVDLTMREKTKANKSSWCVFGCSVWICAIGIYCRKLYEESLIRSGARTRLAEKHGRER